MTLYLASKDGLNNITIDGRKVGVGFKAHFNSPLAAIRWYIINKGAGYAGGNGGRLRYEIWSDLNGHPGVAIATGFLIEDPQYTEFLNAGGFPLIGFPSFPVLKKGAWYHFVMTNIDPQPAVNFPSFDALLSGVKDPTGKFYANPDPDSFIEYSDTSGTNWTRYKEGGTGNEMMASPFNVFYANGKSQGNSGYQIQSGATGPVMPQAGTAYGFIDS